MALLGGLGDRRVDELLDRPEPLEVGVDERLGLLARDAESIREPEVADP